MKLDVSIVVCTYNDSHFLPKCLESCLAQDCNEIVVVDDGSDTFLDHPRQIIIKNGIEYIRHGKNRGVAAARNTGFSLAKNEWIIPLDADDTFYPGGVAALKNAAFRADEAPDLVVGDLTENKIVCKPPMAHKPAKNGIVQMTAMDWKKCNMGFATSLIRKSLWTRRPYIADRIVQYEDFRMFISMFLAGAKWMYVPFTVYDHVIRADGMLRRMDKDCAKYTAEATEELTKLGI